jgi:hypothetical protein
MNHTIKSLPESAVKHNGSALRVAIVHARWNTAVIDALVAGAFAKLKERGVKDSNIVVQSVPGSFELPLACQRCVVSPTITNLEVFEISFVGLQGHRGRTRPSGLERHGPARGAQLWKPKRGVAYRDAGSSGGGDNAERALRRGHRGWCPH